MGLLKKRSPQQQLFNAIAAADVRKVRKVLEKNPGLDVNVTNGRNMTALDACAEQMLEEVQKPSKTLRFGNPVSSWIANRKIKAINKKVTGLANVWSEIVNSSGTLKRYAGDAVFDNETGSFNFTGANASITCRTPRKASGSHQPPTRPTI